MPNISNPRKEFNFTINFEGLNPWLAQEVTTPEVSLDATAHGDANYEVKTAGMRKVGDMNIKKLCPSDATDLWVSAWIERCQSAYTQSGELPSEYKRDLMIEELGPDNITVIGRWELVGVWPKRRGDRSLNRLSSNNILEDIDFSVDDCRQTL